jgi:hypothetical protein
MSDSDVYFELNENEGGNVRDSKARSSRLLSEVPFERRESLAELSRSSLFVVAAKRKASRQNELLARKSERAMSSASDLDEPQPGASTSSAIFNLSNTILGTGVLTMPYACTCGSDVFALNICFEKRTVLSCHPQAICVAYLVSWSYCA